jgi:hypothetical protein
MKYLSIRKTLVAAFTLFCGTAGAQVAWTFPSNIKVAKGSKATYSISLEDDVCQKYIGGSFTMTMPDGLSVVAGSAAAADARKDDHVFKITDSGGGVYKCVLTSGSNSYLKGTSGTIASFDIACDAGLTDGDYTVNISAQNVTYKNDADKLSKVRPADITFTVTVGAAASSVTITLENDWITYCCSKSLDFSSLTDVTAYEVTDVTATSAKLNKLEKVYAGEGFIIKGSSGSEITVPFTDSCDPTGKNLLVGVLELTPLAAGNFVLYNGEFRKSDGTGMLKANKAYLPADKVPTSAKGITFVFGDNTTGINEIQKADTEGAIYNLSGMRVSKTQKGVYIMNGRKVIVK